jgi:hypothetical protein
LFAVQMENDRGGFLEPDYDTGYEGYGPPIPIDNETLQIERDLARALVGENLSLYAKVSLFHVVGVMRCSSGTCTF